MERQNQKKLDWTDQFSDLPEGWDVDLTVFNKMVEEKEFLCEGENCPIRGTAVVKNGREENLFFVKLVYTSLAMEDDGLTPGLHPKTGQRFFGHKDVWRHVYCHKHMCWAEGVAQKSHEGLSVEERKRGDKVEAQSFPLFKNLKKLAEKSRENKRSEGIAKFFFALTEGADISVGVALGCVRPLDPATPKDKVENYLARGAEILGIVTRSDDIRIYSGVRGRQKRAFEQADIWIYSNNMTLGHVEENIQELAKEKAERSAIKAAREAEIADRAQAVKERQATVVASTESAAAEVLALIRSATKPSTEPTVDRKGKKSPKQRKSAPPSAARQIDEQLEAGGRATLASDTPDVLVDEHAGELRPTLAVSLGENPEVREALAAARASIK